MAWEGYKPKTKEPEKGKPGRKAGEGKVFTTVWDQYSTTTRKLVDDALTQLIGRYGDGDTPATPMKTYEGGGLWTANNRVDWNKLGFTDMPETPEGNMSWYRSNQKPLKDALAQEKVTISLKCGGQIRMDFFVGGKKTITRPPADAITEMKAIKRLVYGMRKDDGGFGTFFHETAVKKAKDSGKNGNKKYNKEVDCMLLPEDVAAAKKQFGK